MSSPVPPARPTIVQEQPAKPTAQVVVGLVLVLLALIPLIITYVEPVLWTLRSSFRPENIVALSDDVADNRFSFENFGDLPRAGFFGGIGAALVFAVVPILVVLIAAPVLAWAAHLGGRVARWIVRGLLALPLAAYAPAAVIAAGIFDDGIHQMRSMYWWGTFGLIAALAVTAYLAALRRRDPARGPWGALAVAVAIGFVAVLAAALQEFTYSSVVVTDEGAPPMGRLWIEATSRFDFGPLAAGSALILLVVMLLGLGTTVLIVLTGLRLEFDSSARSADERPGWPTSRVVGAVVGGVALIVVLALTSYGLSSEFGHLFDTQTGLDDLGNVGVNTWIPPLLSTMVGVFAATAAAFGISWLRPLGRHSEWLLVPFGLFLFVGLGPLALRFFAADFDDKDGEMSFLSLVPPWWVAVPALFGLSLLLRGQALRGEALRQEGRPGSTVGLLLPVLPMLAVVFLITWVAQAQDVGWAFVANPSGDPAYQSGPMALFTAARFGTVPVSLALPAAVIVLLFVLAVVTQLFYLDRIALRVGPPERDDPPRV